MKSEKGTAVTQIEGPTDAGEFGAGWYPDPVGGHELRYWDGSTWTDRVVDRGVETLAPLHFSQTASSSPDGRTAAAPKVGDPDNRPFHKKKRWWLAGGVVVVLVAVIASSGGGNSGKKVPILDVAAISTEYSVFPSNGVNNICDQLPDTAGLDPTEFPSSIQNPLNKATSAFDDARAACQRNDLGAARSAASQADNFVTTAVNAAKAHCTQESNGSQFDVCT